MFVVYILYSPSLQKYYSGQTADIEKRLLRHNSGLSTYSKNGIPWKLVWKQEVETRAEAMKIETQIKKQGAKRFLERIAQKNIIV